MPKVILCIRPTTLITFLQRKLGGGYRIQSGELIRVGITSDFSLDEADKWRPEARRMMKERSGWDNVFFSVTCENQKWADERIPILLELPFMHKGIKINESSRNHHFGG